MPQRPPVSLPPSDLSPSDLPPSGPPHAGPAYTPPPPALAHRLRGVLTGLFVAGLTLPLVTLLGEVRATGAVLLAVLGLGALAGAFSWTRRLLLGGAGALAGVLAVCLLTPVLRGPLSALIMSQPPVKADAIVVLGGGIQCASGTMGGASLNRLMRGLELWQAGYAPLLTVSEQSNLLGPENCPKLSALQRAEVSALYGSGGPQIVNLKNVTTTRDEAARVRDLARQLGWRRVLMVTSPSHSRRAQALFRDYGVDAVSVPTQETGFDLTLPLPSDRLSAFRVLTYEGLSRVKAALGGTPER